MIELRDRIRTFNLSAASFALSALSLGHALQISSGTFHPSALMWMSVAFALCLAASLTHRLNGRWSRAGMTTTTAFLAVGVLWQLQQLLTTNPGYHIPPTTSRTLFNAGLVIEGLLVLLGVSGWRATRRAWFPLVLATNVLLGSWMLRASPAPRIDVVVVHKEAMDALLNKSDPYRISFPNIYGRDWKYYYNPTVVYGDRIAVGYPYPPASLILAMPGYVMLGDYRYSELGFLIAAAALIGYSRRHIVAKLAAVALLTTPRGFFVIEQGWTEPVALFLVALTTFLLKSGPLRASWAAGLMLATKQYLPFAGLAVLRMVFLDRRRWVWTLLWIILTGAIAVLPFALWHTNSFMRSVVWLQTLEPFRNDSLSYLSWAARHGWGRGSFLWALGAATVAAVLGLVTMRSTPSGFAASTALTMFAMFAFGSKAFCNYYYFVIGAMCCAIAAFTSADEEEIALRQ